jgi:hypothetical protein
MTSITTDRPRQGMSLAARRGAKPKAKPAPKAARRRQLRHAAGAETSYLLSLRHSVGASS